MADFIPLESDKTFHYERRTSNTETMCAEAHYLTWVRSGRTFPTKACSKPFNRGLGAYPCERVRNAEEDLLLHAAQKDYFATRRIYFLVDFENDYDEDRWWKVRHRETPEAKYMSREHSNLRSDAY